MSDKLFHGSDMETWEILPQAYSWKMSPCPGSDLIRLLPASNVDDQLARPYVRSHVVVMITMFIDSYRESLASVSTYSH